MVKKGVSPVIATILMVMITVGLVAFSYTWLMTVVEHGKETEGDQRESFQKTQQQIGIGTVFSNDTHTLFEVKAMGVNTLSIDLKGTKFYIDGVPKEADEWDSYINCTDIAGTLAPGASCYGMIAGKCNIGDTLKVAVSWGAETSKKIDKCTGTS